MRWKKNQEVEIWMMESMRVGESDNPILLIILSKNVREMINS